MDVDDPGQPLLGRGAARRGGGGGLCGAEAWRRRVPVTVWLPKYSLHNLVRDSVAGVTVALTSIPQGIAYALIAGLPPQVGLYSSIFPGLVYAVFGSCKDVTVGPTAILATLLAKYVAESEDFAYLASFLTGCMIFLLGVFQLGFLLELVSRPVIAGFTSAAALQISSSQLKSLFRISGSSGGTCVSALVNFFRNLGTLHAADSALGCVGVAVLLAAKHAPVPASPQVAGVWRHVVRARNAVLVLAAAALAYLLHVYGLEPFALTGEIKGGLPDFKPPPFSTTVGNNTLYFPDMLAAFGPAGLVMPLVAIMESIAIAKAFAGTAAVDGTQEMVAVGLCNMVGAFCQAMPATGSFTRTALNHASGVTTQAGSFFKACIVLAGTCLCAGALSWVPRAALAAVILAAMVALLDVAPLRLWRHCTLEALVYCVTLCVGVSAGLEAGVAAGVAVDALRLLLANARPTIDVEHFTVGRAVCSRVSLAGCVRGAGAARVLRRLRAAGDAALHVLVLDGARLHALDMAVAESIVAATLEAERAGRRVLLWQFPAPPLALLDAMAPGFSRRAVRGRSIDAHVLELGELQHGGAAGPAINDIM